MLLFQDLLLITDRQKIDINYKIQQNEDTNQVLNVSAKTGNGVKFLYGFKINQNLGFGLSAYIT